MTAAAPRGAMHVVWRFAFSTTLIVLAFSMTGPVLAVSLQQAGASTSAVGLFAMVPPDAAHRAYLASMRQETCRFVSTMHNAMRPPQREHAAQRLRAWQRDLRELAGGA